MFKLVVISALSLSVMVACSAQNLPPTPTTTPVGSTVMQWGESQTVNDVTVTVESVTVEPYNLTELMAIDTGYANLFEGAHSVATLRISASNNSSDSVDLYPATFGHVLIGGEQIDLASFQWFADGDNLDSPLLSGANKDAEIWFPLTESQTDSIQSSFTFVITDGINSVYTFDL